MLEFKSIYFTARGFCRASSRYKVGFGSGTVSGRQTAEFNLGNFLKRSPFYLQRSFVKHREIILKIKHPFKILISR